MTWTKRILLFIWGLIAYYFIVRPYLTWQGLRDLTDLVVGFSVLLMGCAMVRAASRHRGSS